jgi:hypothetical protein
MVMVAGVPVRPKLWPPPSVAVKPERVICDEVLLVVGEI